MYIIDYGSAGPLDTFPTYVTDKYASPYLDIGIANEKSDYETLWFTLLSLYKPLPWENIGHGKASFLLKIKALPEKYEDINDEREQKLDDLAKIFTPLLFNNS